MPTKNGTQRNDYKCSIERNQGGKYCVRIRAAFPHNSWTLSVYFLASSFDRAMKKLEQSLQFLQRKEDKLWFWGVDRSDDPNFSSEMLREAGLQPLTFPPTCGSFLRARAHPPRACGVYRVPQTSRRLRFFPG